MHINKYLVLLCILFLCSCSGMQVNPFNQEGVAAAVEESLEAEEGQMMALEMQAQAVLTEFYNAVNQGLFDRAVVLYGGSYEELAYFNPTIEPDDQVALLRAACEFNGFMCLPILDSTLVETHNEQNFVFEVTFANLDGSLFVLGPCCGADEETMPPVSEFNVQVRCENETSCQVLDLLPWAP